MSRWIGFVGECKCGYGRLGKHARIYTYGHHLHFHQCHLYSDLNVILTDINVILTFINVILTFINVTFIYVFSFMSLS